MTGRAAPRPPMTSSDQQSEREPDVNLVTLLKTLRTRRSTQKLPPSQPPESTIRRSVLERERRVRSGDRSILSLGLTLVLALVIAACGSGSSAGNGSGSGAGTGSDGGSRAEAAVATASSDQPQGPGGLCDYLSQAAAEAALGEPVDGGAATTVSITGSDICRYTATGSEHNIQIEVQAGLTRQGWEDDLGPTGMLEATIVPGLGEVAYRSADAVFGPGTRLAAFENGTAIWVVISTDADPATVFAAAESVARDLLTSVGA